MKMPYSKFYWRDHISDPCLRSCSYAARGLWTDMLAVMGQADPPGNLEAGGKPLTEPKDIARQTNGEAAEVDRLLKELEQAGVFSRHASGCIYSRRMVQDAKLHEIRSSAGSKGGMASVLLKQNGKQEPKQTLKPSVGYGFCLLDSSSGGDCKGDEKQAEIIYKTYPKHVAKPPALKAIVKALAKLPFEELLAKTKAYAEHCRRTDKEQQFIPHPSTWFNGDQFNDALPVATAGTARQQKAVPHHVTGEVQL